MERLNYGGWNYDDHDDDEEQIGFDGHGQEENQEGRQENHQLEHTQDLDGELDHADGNGEEDFKDLVHLVEHLVEFAEDDSGKTDYEALFGQKSKAARRRRGSFQPRDRGHHKRPVFLKVKDLPDRSQGVEQQAYVPRHYDDPDDEELTELLTKPPWTDEHRTPPEQQRPSEYGEKVNSRPAGEKQGP